MYRKEIHNTEVSGANSNVRRELWHSQERAVAQSVERKGTNCTLRVAEENVPYSVTAVTFQPLNPLLQYLS